MRLGMRAKLLGVTLGLLGALTAGALLTVRHHFGQQLQQQASKELQIGGHVLMSILERSGSQLQGRAQILRDLPSLRAALTKEPNTLEPLLLEIKAVRAANLIWATDPKGIVISSTGESPAVGKDLHQEPLIAAALSGQETLGFDLFGGEWWLIYSLPVIGTVSKEQPRLLGTVTLALLIGEAYMNRLEELMKCSLGFVWGEHQLWSKGWPSGVRQRIAGVAARGMTGPPREISLLKEGHYLWTSRAVTGGEPPIASGPIAVLGAPIDESVIRRTTQRIGWIALSTMGIGALLLIGAIRSITQPLKVLVKDAQRIEVGDFSHRSEVQGDDEIAEMADSFNRMVDRLEDSYREMEKLNRTLEERVKERTRELEEAQTQLLQAEKLASIGQLAAGVAHELNNPLMVIMGNVQLSLREMKRGTQGPKELLSQTEEALKEIEQESQRAKMIVNNLLNFARVTSPSRVETEIHPILDESVKLVSHQADLQSVEVTKRYAAHLPAVKVDPGQIKQVFVNVILNAVQAMPLGGKVTLETGVSGAYLKVLVQDTGVGISSDDLQKVFDPFYTTKEVGIGTGLGLSLSYSIVQNHQGMINLISKVGQGTTVTILLPLTQSP